MKKKWANYIFADIVYTYLLDEKEITIYHKSKQTICKVIKIEHPLRLESDLNHNFLIIMNTINTIFVYSLENFTLQFQVDLGGNASHFLYDKESFSVYATSTDLNKNTFKVFKINLKTQETITKTFDKLSIVSPCFIDKNVCVMIEERIGETIEEINILEVDINDLNILQSKQTKDKIGPLSRVGNLYCYDSMRGLYNYIEEKLYTYEELGIKVNYVLYVKYYNDQYYIFACQDTYVLSNELKILHHLHNDSIEEWINDMLIEGDEIIIIRNNGIQIVSNKLME